MQIFHIEGGVNTFESKFQIITTIIFIIIFSIIVFLDLRSPDISEIISEERDKAYAEGYEDGYNECQNDNNYSDYDLGYESAMNDVASDLELLSYLKDELEYLYLDDDRLTLYGYFDEEICTFEEAQKAFNNFSDTIHELSQEVNNDNN